MPLTVMKGRVVTMGRDGSVPTDCVHVGSGLSKNELLTFKLIYITAYSLPLLYQQSNPRSWNSSFNNTMREKEKGKPHSRPVLYTLRDKQTKLSTLVNFTRKGMH